MNILVTNDDGYNAEGISALRKSLLANFSPEANIYTVAPKSEKSGCGCSITIHNPIEIAKVDTDFYKIDANPADCVKVAVHHLFPQKINLVLSGINAGHNAGYSVFYSGTLGAIFEAYFNNINGIGFSVYKEKNEKINPRVAEYAIKFIETCFTKYPGSYSVNLPNVSKDRFKGFKVVPQSYSAFREKYKAVEMSEGKKHLFIDSHEYIQSKHPESEIVYLEKGFATFTPIKMDLTDYSHNFFQAER